MDGTICPTWDWRHIPDLYSAKAGYSGAYTYDVSIFTQVKVHRDVEEARRCTRHRRSTSDNILSDGSAAAFCSRHGPDLGKTQSYPIANMHPVQCVALAGYKGNPPLGVTRRGGSSL